MYKLTCSVMHVIAAFLQLLQKTLNCQLSWIDSLCPSWISWRRQIFVSILLDCAYGKLPDPSHQYLIIHLPFPRHSLPCFVEASHECFQCARRMQPCYHPCCKEWFQQVGIKCNYLQDNPDVIVTSDFKTHSTKNKYLREPFRHLKKDCLSKTKEDFKKEW